MNMPSFAIPKSTQKSLDLSKLIAFAPSVVAIVASVAIGFFVVWPKFGETLRLQKSNKDLEISAGKLEDKAQALATLDKNKLKSQLGAAEQLLPSEKGIFTFIRQMENVRNDSGVVISNLSVGSVGQFSSGSETAPSGSATAPPPAPAAADSLVTSAGVSQVDMKLSVSSDYKSVLKFLDAVYALPRVTNIKDLTFGVGTTGQISTNLVVSSMWQALPKDLPAVEAPVVLVSSKNEALLSKVENTGAVSSPVVVPDVPKGKPDIFTPF